MSGLSKGAKFFAHAHLPDSQDTVVEPANFQTSPEAGEEKEAAKTVTMQLFHWMVPRK